MSITITNLIKEVKFKAGENLKAGTLNSAFNQPIKLTNALSLAIANFATGSTTVDLETIDQTDLKNIYINALKDIKKLKIGSNEASLDFGVEGSNNDEPFLTLNSKYNSAKTTLKLTNSLISIYANDDETSQNKITIDPVTSTIIASIFEGTASKIKTTNSTSNTDYHIWFGINSQLYKSDKIKFNPSTGTLKLNGTIDFGNNVTLSQSGFSGISSMAETIKMGSQSSSDQWYPILFGAVSNDLEYYKFFYSDDSLKYNPYTKTLNVAKLLGTASKADQLNTSSATSSRFYLTGVTSTSTGYKSAYYTSNVYVENGTLYASSFDGTATSASKADTLYLDTWSLLGDFPLAFSSSNSSGYNSVYYNSNIKVNPYSKIITANISGNSTTANYFSGDKTISFSGMFTGTTTTRFNETVTLEIKYASNYGIKCYNPNTVASSYSINVGLSSIYFVMIISIYGGSAGNKSLMFTITNTSSTSSTICYVDGYNFRLERTSAGTNIWTLKRRSSTSGSFDSSDDTIGSIVIYRFSL